MADLTIERSSLQQLSADLQRSADLLAYRRDLVHVDSRVLGSALVESALVETVSLLEARRSVVERMLSELVAHPTKVVDDFDDLDAVLAGGA
ncbi:hypothetical protein [Agromyces sp. Leaf222]|uniref:hypothetical protein n=1 Tax=Agromyces sp. Leaf222 TaxID=1735688 RepID=UPI0006F8BF4E|nr:hypothetical protein [Agromyces sp. Leaf222]KQM82402.1 hypothetical protein ASE68_03140 [Agromyces sp. Leaf222]